MRKYIEVFVALSILVVILISYIGITFYKIENTPTTEKTFLITKQSILKQNLKENINFFEAVADMIFENNINEMGHDYYFKKIEQDKNVLVLIEKCNILWARLSPDLNSIAFYQTTDEATGRNVVLNYRCTIDCDGKKSWTIEKDSSAYLNVKETIGVKLYNLIFNCDINQNIPII